MLIPIQPVSVDPAKVAFQMCESGEQVTYAQLEDRANQVAHFVSALGIRPGEHVAVLMNNCRELLELCFGLDRSGVYYTLISTRLTTDEIDYIVRDCDARLFVYSGALETVYNDLFTKLPDSLKCMSVGACGKKRGHGDWIAQCAKASTSAIKCQ
jgi:fatty-acyl-CoA synthase